MILCSIWGIFKIKVIPFDVSIPLCRTDYKKIYSIKVVMMVKLTVTVFGLWSKTSNVSLFVILNVIFKHTVYVNDLNTSSWGFCVKFAKVVYTVLFAHFWKGFKGILKGMLFYIKTFLTPYNDVEAQEFHFPSSYIALASCLFFLNFKSLRLSRLNWTI